MVLVSQVKNDYETYSITDPLPNVVVAYCRGVTLTLDNFVD